MASKESILFVHNGKSLGGAPKALRYIIEACRKDSYTCYVACLDCNQTIPYFKEAGAEIIVVDSLPRYTNSTTVSYGPDSRQFQKERKFAAQYAFYWRDILSKYGPFSLVFLNSMVLCELIKPSKSSGCKVIQTVRETVQTGPSLEIMKTIFGEADAVLFISEYDQNLFSFNSTKNVLITDAVEPALYSCGPNEKAALRKAHGLEAEDVVLLFTGGVGYIKGGELLLDSLERVNCPNSVTLFYAGYTSTRGIKSYGKAFLGYFSNSPRFFPERTARKLSRIARNGHLNIRSIGYCPNIQDYYKMSDICMIPYKVPHQAMPIIEAGVAKLPCLVSDFSCYQYEVEDGYNGYLLPTDNPDAWAKKIECLVNDKQKRLQMGLHNYQTAMKRHNINKNTENLLNLINEVLTA